MKKAGIVVSTTNLPALRDSNPILSSVWRVFVYPVEYLHKRFTGTTYTVRVVPNILGGHEHVTVRAYLALLNFKANHRKLIVTDETKNGVQNLVSLVTSANPHDGSSSHSNVAVQVRGTLAEDILDSEKRVIELAGNTFIKPTITPSDAKQGNIDVKLITDKAILDEVITTITATKKGDSVDLLMFYLSERHIIKALIDASKRGVIVRIILDPNKDAFGKQKNGIPNREVADTLVTESGNKISIRWCNTHGEQCHAKMLIVKTVNNHSLILGSANFTRRNIGGYNLESDVALHSAIAYPVWQQATIYFDGLWNNTHGTFSADYAMYQDISKWKKVIAWIMENTGLSTF
jgi:phosphatidylserine/phosphatidylglycerophosphate/cardiolipin synthase-like enzyme